MWSTRMVSTGLVVGGLLASAAPARSQEREISVEGRTGVTFPVGDLADVGAESGLLLGADVLYPVRRRISIYGGLEYDRFNCSSCADVATTGLRGGVSLRFPMPGDAVPWVRGGVTVNRAKGLEPAPGRSSGWRPGLELGGGVDYALTPRFSLEPSARFQSFSTNVGTPGLTMTYFTLDLGARLGL